MIWIPLKTSHLCSIKSLTALRSAKVFHRAKGNPWAGSQPTWWSPQAKQLWLKFWLHKYILCLLITPHSFLTAPCMKSIHWLLSSSMPHFLEMMEFENCFILLREAKVKSLEGKNVNWRSKGCEQGKENTGWILWKRIPCGMQNKLSFLREMRKKYKLHRDI